jgi:hypothetical protein
VLIIDRELCDCFSTSFADLSETLFKTNMRSDDPAQNLRVPSCPLWFKFLVNEKRAA